MFENGKIDKKVNFFCNKESQSVEVEFFLQKNGNV